MHRAIRAQNDDKFDEYSKLTSISFIGTEDMARQEFKAEADINNLLARYANTGVLPLRQGQMGEVDFGMDLQQAIHSVEAAKRMYAKLPDSLRDKYRSWQQLLNALETGELRLDLQQDADEKKATAEVAAARARGDLEPEPDTPLSSGGDDTSEADTPAPRRRKVH